MQMNSILFVQNGQTVHSYLVFFLIKFKAVHVIVFTEIFFFAGFYINVGS